MISDDLEYYYVKFFDALKYNLINCWKITSWLNIISYRNFRKSKIYYGDLKVATIS